MSNQFLKLRRSAVPGKIPTTSSLDYGEIALNTYDGLAFMKKSGSSGEQIVTIGSTSGAFTGSFSGSFTGSLLGTSSYALNVTSASYALNSTSASYALNATSASYALSASYASNATSASYALSASYASNATSASYSTIAMSASYAFNATSASYALSASYSSTSSLATRGIGSFTGSFSGSLYNLQGTVSHIPYFSQSQVLADSTMFQVDNGGGAYSIAVNQNGVSGLAPEALFVYQPSATSYNVISGKGNLNNYLQLNIQNENNGANASSDIVATANNGNETTNYIDMGINGASYTGFLGGPNDAYIYSTGSNFHIGNINPNTHLGFFVGGDDVMGYNKLQLNPNNQHSMTGSLDISGSLIVLDSITGSLQGTASWAVNALTSSYILNAVSASYALNASNAQTASSADNFLVRGTLTAQTIVAQTITSSIDFVTGSTRFGSLLSNTHEFTGSVSITGSLVVNNSSVVLSNQTGSMSVLSASYASGSTSASYAIQATNADTASYVLQAVSASYASASTSASYAIQATNADTASYVLQVVSASYASASTSASYASASTSASYATQATNADTASYVLQVVSSSYASSSTSASYSLNSTSASYSSNSTSASYATNATNADTSSYVLQAVSASYASASTSASYAFNATTASYSSNSTSASYAVSASQAQNAVTASYLSGYVSPFPYTGSAQITGSLGVTGSVSISGSTGTLFSANVDSIVFTGSFAQSGSVTVSGSINVTSGITGSLLGTASWANNATTASYALNSTSASYASTSTSASYALNSTSASYAQTASYATNITISGSINNVDYIDFDTTASFAAALGRLGYDSGEGTLQFGLAGGNVTLNIGEDLYQYVYNAETASMTKGQVVFISGSQGNRIAVKLASATNEYGSANTLGFVAETIAAGAEGWVMTEGNLRKLNTIGLIGGELLYLGTTPGTYTQTPPIAPNHGVRLGYAERIDATIGSIYVKIDNGYELGELHNVIDNSNTGSFGDLFIKSGSVWINSKQLTGSYGLTGSLIATSITATSITGSLFGTASWANNAITASYALNSTSASYALSSSYAANADLLDGKDSTIFATTGSNIFVGNQTVTGSLFTSGSNTLIGTTTLTGSLLVSGSTTQTGNNTLIGNTTLSGSITISGSNGPGSTTASVQIYGDIRQSGYHRFDPVSTNIDTSISASYIYVSGSTNDLYFSQNGAGYANTTRLRWLEGNLYTGLLNGGLITTQSSTVYRVSSGSGIIVNLNASLNDNPYPTVQYVNWGNLTASIAPLTASYQQAFVSIDSTGNIYQQGTPYVAGQFDTAINIGVVLFQNQSTINGVKTQPSTAYGFEQSQNIFNRAFGPLKLSGFILSPSGSSTGSLVVGSGTAYSPGSNYAVDPNNPSYASDSGTSVSKIFRYYQSGSNWVYQTNGGAGFGAIDPTQYSNNGVLTAVPPPANLNWTIQRVFWFPNSVAKAIVVYYGNAYYGSESEAIANINIEPFVEAPNTAANAIYLGAIIINGSGVFTNANDFTIVPGGLFRQVGGSGGGGSVVTTRLVDLSDVGISGPTDGQALVYNSTSLKWENKSYISASISGNAATATTASYILNAVSASYASSSTSASYALNATSASYSLSSTSASYSLNSTSASYALSASNAQTASYVLQAISASYALSSTSASYALNATSASFAATAALAPNYVPTSVTSSMLAPYVLTSQTSSMSVLSASYASGSTSASYSLQSTNAATASYVQNAQTASYVLQAVSASFASTASSADDFTVRGTLTAQTIVAQVITSSTDFVTGSTRFGSLLTNTHQFTGSVSITGSLDVVGGITGSLLGTASWANNAITSSYALDATSASYALNSTSASYSLNSTSASYALNTTSASYALNSTSASFATDAANATTASYVLNAVSASFASTASYVNTLNQNVLITGSLTIGSSSLGANENTLVVGLPPGAGAGEGGQILLQAPGGTYTSASMWDNYQNQTRLLRGTNAGSDAIVASFNMHSKQVQFPTYTGSGAFPGSATANLSVDSNGNIITTAIGSSLTGGSTNYVARWASTTTLTTGSLFDSASKVGIGNITPSYSLDVTGDIRATGAVYANANGTMYFRGGDDAELWDINVANTLGVYGQQDQGIASIKLGSDGGIISGRSGSIGIGTTTPNSASLHVSGNVFATSFTGSLFGTASWANNAVTAAFAPLYTLVSVTGSMLAPYVLNSVTSSMSVLSASYASGSTSASFASTAASAPLYTLVSVTGSMLAPYVLNSVTSSMSVLSASYASGSTSASFASTASSADDFLVRGTLTAQTIVVQTITSSVDFVTGSTRFGSLLSNTHQFTGSVSVTGSLNVSTGGGITGSLFGTSSWANNSLTSSYANATSTIGYTIGGSQIYYTSVLSSTSPSTVNVFTNDTGSFTSAFYNYTLSSGSNARSGQIAAVWVGNSIQYNDYSTVDIGTTSELTASVAIVTGQVQLNVQVPSSTAGWRVKSTATYI